MKFLQFRPLTSGFLGCLASLVIGCGLFGGGHGGGNHTDGRQCNSTGDNLWQSKRLMITLLSPHAGNQIFSPCPYTVKAVGDSVFFGGFVDGPPSSLNIWGGTDVYFWVFDSNHVQLYATFSAFNSYAPDSVENGTHWFRSTIGGRYPGGRGATVNDTLWVQVRTNASYAYGNAAMPGIVTGVAHTLLAPTDLTVGQVGNFRAKPDYDTTSYLYSWLVNGQTVSGAYGATLATSFSSQALNTVSSVVIRADSTVDTVRATVDTRLRVVVSGPTSITLAGGTCTYIATRRGGNGTVSYSWTFDGTPDGSNSSSYSPFFDSVTGNHVVSVNITDQSNVSVGYGLTVRVSSSGTTRCFQ